VSVTEHEGRWLLRDDGVPVLVCLHPAAILRADPQRQDALRARWIDSLRQASALLLEAETQVRAVA
jgi:DNA polymerase